MKTPNILLILLCCPVFLLAQETVTVKTKPKKWDWYYEEYQVLKSDRKTFHGPYKKFSKNDDVILEEGNYNNGKKDGLWAEYTNKRKLITKGYYTDNIPSGVWEFYDQSGNLVQRYDYTTSTLMFSKVDEKNMEHDLIVYNGNDSSKLRVDSIPQMVGGAVGWQRYLNKSLRYPQDAIDNNVMGTVIIGFVINPDGTMSDFWIKKSAHKSLDAEALRVLKEMPHKWIPAKIGGKPVKVSFHQPLVFRLEQG